MKRILFVLLVSMFFMKANAQTISTDTPIRVKPHSKYYIYLYCSPIEAPAFIECDIFFSNRTERIFLNLRTEVYTSSFKTEEEYFINELVFYTDEEINYTLRYEYSEYHTEIIEQSETIEYGDSFPDIGSAQMVEYYYDNKVYNYQVYKKEDVIYSVLYEYIDTCPPVIYGNDIIFVNGGHLFIKDVLKSYYAHDTVSGKVDIDISYDSYSDSNEVGEYSIVLIATDDEGNASKKDVKIVVNWVTKPYFVNNDEVVYLQNTDNFNVRSYFLVKIKQASNITYDEFDTSKPGVYFVNYEYETKECIYQGRLCLNVLEKRTYQSDDFLSMKEMYPYTKIIIVGIGVFVLMNLFFIKKFIDKKRR